jgi:hypothetical protein
MAALNEDCRDHQLTATYRSVKQRWIVIYSAPRQTQAQRTVNTQWGQQSDRAGKAWKKLGTTS